MSCAQTLEKYLAAHRVAYDVVAHPRCYTSMGAAHLSQIDAERLAKAVLLEDDRGYMVAVLPASCQVKMRRLRRETGRQLWMASESEMMELFPDCERGAMPALPAAYGLDAVWDDRLGAQPELYFEAGDHERLIHLRTQDFIDMMASAPHGHFSSHA